MEYFNAFVKHIKSQVAEWYIYDGHMHNGELLDKINGVYIRQTPSEDIAEEIKEWVTRYYKATDYIDWARDDPYGFGIGRNAYGGGVDGGISFERNVTIDENGNALSSIRNLRNN